MYELTVAYLPNIFSPIAFTCMIRQNFHQIFLMYGMYVSNIATYVTSSAKIVLMGTKTDLSDICECLVSLQMAVSCLN